MDRKSVRKKKLAAKTRRQELRPEHAKLPVRSTPPRNQTGSAGRTSQYPPFVFIENDAPAQFVQLVRKAVAEIDFDDRSCFTMREAAGYRLIRDGFFPQFYELDLFGELVEQRDAVHRQANNLGEQVFKRIPATDLRRFLPHNDVAFRPNPKLKAIEVLFRSLRRGWGVGGTTYFSRHRPVVEVNGLQYAVGFSTHAIERTAERRVIGPLGYAGLGDIFSVFDECLEYEVCVLPGNQLGFTFWQPCDPGYWMTRIAISVLGEQYRFGHEYAYRVGYCPAVLDNGFLKAKTLLFPGWVGTPEYEMMRSARIPEQQKCEWLDLLENMDALKFRTESDALLKFFQDQGHPQIRSGWPRMANVFPVEEKRTVSTPLYESQLPAPLG